MEKAEFEIIWESQNYDGEIGMNDIESAERIITSNL